MKYGLFDLRYCDELGAHATPFWTTIDVQHYACWKAAKVTTACEHQDRNAG
jgi:hypothetical protein